MKILITGASGFIGSNLVSSLHSNNDLYSVLRSCTDQNGPAEIIISDLSRPKFTEHFPSDVECVIHLAQSRRYRDFPSGARDMLALNVNSIIEILDWCVRTNVKQLIFASSANVYEQADYLLTEDSKLSPSSYYGETKLAAENLIKYYADYLKIHILRLFTVYGPGQTDMLIPNIISKIKSSQSIDLAEGVGVSFTPIFVDDVCSIIKSCMIEERLSNLEIINLCGVEVVDLNTLTTNLEEMLSTDAVRIFSSERPVRIQGSNEYLLRKFPNLQLTNFKSGLKRTLGLV